MEVIKVKDWVSIKHTTMRPVDGYGQVIYISPATIQPIQYTVEASGVCWYYYEFELELLDPEKILGKEYFE